MDAKKMEIIRSYTGFNPGELSRLQAEAVKRSDAQSANDEFKRIDVVCRAYEAVQLKRLEQQLHDLLDHARLSGGKSFTARFGR